MMEWDITPLVLACTLVAGVGASVAIGDWLKERANIDAFWASIAAGAVISGVVAGFWVPA